MDCYFCVFFCIIRISLLFCSTLVIIMMAVYGRCTQTYTETLNVKGGTIMQTAVEIETKLKAKADEDEAFRARLLEDPRTAIKEVTGLTVPEGFSIHVHEETATDFHLVIPPASRSLSDQEIREASGGMNWSALPADY